MGWTGGEEGRLASRDLRGEQNGINEHSSTQEKDTEREWREGLKSVQKQGTEESLNICPTLADRFRTSNF